MFDPDYAAPVDPVERARAFALAAYGSAAELEHPEHVRALVEAAGADEESQEAALLHDLVEDTDTELVAIEAEFGPRVAALVGALTEDDSIESYGARKAEHRERARDAGADVALLFVADKLSNARRMKQGLKEPDPAKVGHDRATLATMREAYPELPLLGELEQEL